jgi:hypothetical protein
MLNQNNMASGSRKGGSPFSGGDLSFKEWRKEHPESISGFINQAWINLISLIANDSNLTKLALDY